MIYVIKNEVLEVGINEIGAELEYIKKDNVNRMYDRSGCWKKQSPLLFPMIGVTKDKTYYYNNTSYKMESHGFVFDKLFKVTKQSDTSITLMLSDDKESYLIYPFKFNLIVTYSIINNEVNVKWDVVNTDNKQLLFNIGGHPGFKFDCEDNKTYQDYTLSFDNEIDYTVYGLEGSAVTQLINYNTKLKNVNISEMIFKHQTVIFKDVNNATMHCGNKSIRIDCKTPYLAFWHPENPTFLCIEPWDGIPEEVSFNRNLEDKLGIIKLDVNKTYTTGYKITIN